MPIRTISSKVERLAHNRLAQVRFLDGPPEQYTPMGVSSRKVRNGGPYSSLCDGWR